MLGSAYRGDGGKMPKFRMRAKYVKARGKVKKLTLEMEAADVAGAVGFLLFDALKKRQISPETPFYITIHNLDARHPTTSEKKEP